MTQSFHLEQYAKIEAIKARVEAMKVANDQRKIQDYSIAYDDIHFFQAEQELNQIAEKLTEKTP
jgi:hypothetical protein